MKRSEGEVETLSDRLNALKEIINHVVTFGEEITAQDLKRHSTQILISFRSVVSVVSNDEVRKEAARLILIIDEVVQNRRRGEQHKKSKD